MVFITVEGNPVVILKGNDVHIAAGIHNVQVVAVVSEKSDLIHIVQDMEQIQIHPHLLFQELAGIVGIIAGPTAPLTMACTSLS